MTWPITNGYQKPPKINFANKMCRRKTNVDWIGGKILCRALLIQQKNMRRYQMKKKEENYWKNIEKESEE